MHELKGGTALVTGCDSGIGLGIAHALIEAGMTAVICGIVEAPPPGQVSAHTPGDADESDLHVAAIWPREVGVKVRQAILDDQLYVITHAEHGALLERSDVHGDVPRRDLTPPDFPTTTSLDGAGDHGGLGPAGVLSGLNYAAWFTAAPSLLSRYTCNRTVTRRKQ